MTVGTFLTPIGDLKIVRDDQGNKIGVIQPGQDKFGNKVFTTMPTLAAMPSRCDVLETMTEGAGRFWLWSLHETYGGMKMRGVL